MDTDSTMDEAVALEALSDILNRLTENPYDISVHAENVRIARATGMEDQVESALDMVTAYWAAGDYVWLPLIEMKIRSANLEDPSDLSAVLELVDRAERDYLSMPLLQRHLEFVLERYEHFASSESKRDVLGEMFSEAWTREAMAAVVSQGIGHLTQSHLLFDIQRDWEMDILANVPEAGKAPHVEIVETMLLERLRQPHANHADTLQAYSTFTTNHKPADQYEALLVQASKSRNQPVRAYQLREELENALVQSGYSLESYAYYLAAERRRKTPDVFITKTLYERAIAEADKRRWTGQPGAEEALRSFWSGYLDFLRIQDVDEEIQLMTLKRATRSVPASGEVWARYTRFLERAVDGDDAPAEITAAYEKTKTIAPLQADVDQIVAVILATAGYEKRRLGGMDTVEAAYDPFVNVMLEGINAVRKASTSGDPRLRLEKFFSAVSNDVPDLIQHALVMWEDATKFYKSSYLAWIAYTEMLIKHHLYVDARRVFKEISRKNLDWPEALWEAWLSFEQTCGSVQNIEDCIDAINDAQSVVYARRMKEAEKANQAAMQIIEEQANAIAVAGAPNLPQDNSGAVGVIPMDVDTGTSSASDPKKRKADDETPQEEFKKLKIDQKPGQLKRDRENSTVFVADLPTGTQEDELVTLFKDCGSIREVKITQLPNSLVATVEFNERDSVPAALTKDKKRLRGEEIAVHLAWRSTLYVTNFPERADDAYIRNLFSKYGTIFDVRWPSKKFKATRRFCYVQYTTPSVAEAALELHAQELEPGLPLTVLVSNPERRKDRTDNDANDREIYVAGLSKFVTKNDLEALFKTYGPVKEVRMATEKDGRSKGFAFVEFEQEKDAILALGANNHELKKRRMAVTLADTHVKTKQRDPEYRADLRNRTLRVRGLPSGAQDGLLQQAIEKHVPVTRVEVFADKDEAEITLEHAADAGKLLLLPEQIIFNGIPLKFVAQGPGARSTNERPMAPPPASGLFVPRAAISRPRAGLGSKKKATVISATSQASSASSLTPSVPAASSPAKGQDDFRRMLSGGN